MLEKHLQSNEAGHLGSQEKIGYHPKDAPLK